MDLFSDRINFQDLEIAKKLFEESRAGFLKLFNNSPVCMSMTTTNPGKRVYVRVNPRFLELFGYDESEVIGKTSVEIGILDQAESDKVAEIIFEKGRLQNDYVKCIAKGGKIVHTVSSIEMMEMSGETYLVSFFLDISKIIEQQEIIEEHVQQIEAVNKELEAFSYSVSHDLRAPLRAIDSFSKLLERKFADVLNEDGKKWLSIIQFNAQMMSTLIEDLLAFARLGKGTIVKKDMDMNNLVSDILIDLKQSLNHKADIRLGVLHAAKGDQTLIKEVWVNLISNAIKYSSKKETPLIEISSEIRNGKGLYRVKDNGEGFDMNYAHKLFHAFQRLHSNEEFEGTGIGLAIVQRIINKHGGGVYAEGEVGKGAEFTFTLPL